MICSSLFNDIYNMNNGSFVISLDYEMGFGLVGHDKKYVHTYKTSNVQHAVKALNRIRETLRKYGVKLTVCYVGGIGMHDMEEFFSKAPIVPTYNRKELSPQQMIEDNPDLKECQEIFFRPDIVKSLVNDTMVEVGSHTFIHYFCLEEGQKIEEFEADMKATINNSLKPMKSIIFPRNQIKKDYLLLCKKYGFTHYRGMRENFLWKLEPERSRNIIRRFLRLVDAYIPLIGSNSFDVSDDGILRNVPGSAFFRPYSRKLRFLENIKVWRICWSMKKAAKNKKVYHLWWHPHNFGANTDKNIQELERICRYFVWLRDKYGMTSNFISDL